MAVIAYPLNLEEYIGAEVVQLWHYGRTNGVFSAGNNLSVTASGGMNVSVSKGVAWMSATEFGGIVVGNKDPLTLNIAMADSIMRRIDRVVIRWNVSSMTTKPTIVIKKGVLSANPTAPSVERSASIWELGLADILINAGTITINQGMITDQRLNESVCGIVRDGVTHIPTATLESQWKSWFTGLKTDAEKQALDLVQWIQLFKNETNINLINWFEEKEKEFYTWFDTIKDILDDNVAANLLIMIQELQQQVDLIKSEITHSSLTKSGNTLLFENVLRDSLFTSAVVKGVTVQSGTPSTTSPVTVSGSAATQVTVAGRNLLNTTPISGTSSGVTITANENGSFNLNGTQTASVNWNLHARWEHAPIGVPLLLSGSSANVRIVIATYNAAGTWLRNVATVSGVAGAVAFTLTPLGSGEYYRAYLYTPSGTLTVSNETVYPQIERGSQRTAYEPFFGISYALPAISALYGDTAVADTYDAVSGVETRRWYTQSFTGTESWVRADTATTGSYRFRIDGIPPAFAPSANNVKGNILSSHYPSNSAENIWQAQQGIGIEITGKIYIYDSGHNTTIENWRAWLAAQYAAGKPLKIVYQLATYNTTQRSRQMITSISPTTNMLADSGNMEATLIYDDALRDIKLNLSDHQESIDSIMKPKIFPVQNGTGYRFPWGHAVASGSLLMQHLTVNTTVSARITFPVGLFTGTVVAIAGAQTSDPGSVNITTTNISTTGFDIYFNRTGSAGSMAVKWFAYGT